MHSLRTCVCVCVCVCVFYRSWQLVNYSFIMWLVPIDIIVLLLNSDPRLHIALDNASMTSSIAQHLASLEDNNKTVDPEAAGVSGVPKTAAAADNMDGDCGDGDDERAGNAINAGAGGGNDDDLSDDAGIDTDIGDGGDDSGVGEAQFQLHEEAEFALPDV